MLRRLLAFGALLTLVAVSSVVFTWGGSADTNNLGPVGEIPNYVVRGPDRDVPCVEQDDGSQVCATPVRTLTALEAETGVPLTIERLSIPLDHKGPYRVLLGQAELPRGIVETMSFSIANGKDGTFLAPLFRLELEEASTKSRLPLNVYEKGVVKGVQLVDVYLTFDLQAFKPDAVVEVENVEVR